MNGQVVDYRVSAIAVICKDCNENVLYPASHKCQQKINPPLPLLHSLPIQQENKKPLLRQLSTTALSSSTATEKKQESSFISLRLKRSASNKEGPVDKSYFDHYTTFLPNQPKPKNQPFLWNKGKKQQNEKYKLLATNHCQDEKQPNSKLWGKLLKITPDLSSQDDNYPESDGSDWEGETHTSRVLREYYEKKQQTIPNWLIHQDQSKKNNNNQNKNLDSSINRPNIEENHHHHLLKRNNTTNRRLWEKDENNSLTAREKERNQLRQLYYAQQQQQQQEKKLQRQLTMDHHHHHYYQQEQNINDIMMQQAKYVALSRSRSDHSGGQRPKRYLDPNRKDGLNYFL
ncbi:unnamed protein product [Cunninghamella echinulata]